MARLEGKGARSRSRALIIQALYQEQLAATGKAGLLSQFHERAEYGRADREYFDEVLSGVLDDREALERTASEFLDRPLSQLDPVERAILMLGLYELRSRPEIPFRVVINEAVNLTRRFGATEGHKYVNAVLDRAASVLRPDAAPSGD